MTQVHTDRATIRATYPQATRLRLRGSGAGLGWTRDRQPDAIEDDTAIFHLDVPHGESIEVKTMREGSWMTGRNAVLGCGDVLELFPTFDHGDGQLCAAFEVPVPNGRALRVRVFLPPSYAEQPTLRYPVVYVQDGQAVWSDSTDPFGNWGLDLVLNELWDVGAVAEIIIVSIDTSVERLQLLGPVRDARYGGGGGAAHLKAIVDLLKPKIDEAYRTHSERTATTLMGSSMGGLFSFYGAWERPEIFGGAICLSPSFWWSDRFMVRTVSGDTCPTPRPHLYLDSAVATSSGESDASTRDGVHVVRALHRALVVHCYEPGDDLHLLSWTGHQHNPTSWAARVAVPLQLFHPRSV
jgi:predicted alpha/beta superfamily hydrolase